MNELGTRVTVESNVTNAELREQFAELPAFKDGKVILVGIEHKATVTRCMFIQNRTDLPRTTPTEDNALLAMAMNWSPNDGRLVRTWMNFEPETFQFLTDNGVDVGSTADDLFIKLAAHKGVALNFTKLKIAVVEDDLPESWINAEGNRSFQKPLSDSKSRVLTANGKFIYSHTTLCMDDTIQDIVLKVDERVLNQSVPTAQPVFSGSGVN